MTTKELLDSWLSKNYSTLQDRAYKICNSEPNDILNELCLELYSLPEEKLLHLINSNELLLYFIGMLRYSAYSKSSRYQLKYRQVDTIDNTDLSELNLPDIQDIDLYYEQMDVVSSIRQELPWYINQIIDLKQKYT